MRSVALVLALTAACSDSPKTLGPTDPQSLLPTLEALSAMGEKRAGTPAGKQAAEYIQGRFEALGLSDVHTETFQFPAWNLGSKTFSVTVDGQPVPMAGFDVFEAAGSGTITNAQVIDAGTATDGELATLDLTGKVAMVKRSTSFHRSSQLRNVIAKGAVAMLYLSVAPMNLRQVGSVRFDWEAVDAIPAITIGATDADVVVTAVTGGRDVRATMTVSVTVTPGIGTNVVGRIEGKRPEQIIMGAHYDTWFSGSSDNGSGVAELLAVAERRLQRGKPEYTLVFVAYDGEEIGLYGGYDYLHKHQVVEKDPIMLVLNFESPSANNPDIAAVVHSNQAKLDEALQAAHLRQIYGVYAGLEIVAQLFGGIIPTDIQGHYRSGMPTVTTAVTNPYYHTVQDTPDKVDLQLLAESTDGFDAAIDLIGKLQPADLEMHDTAVWTADVTGGGTSYSVLVKDGNGAIKAGAIANAYVLYDDFSMAASKTATTDSAGKATFTFTGAELGMGSGNRFLHVTAGPVYPLSETILALP